MALVVETGEGLSNSESYISVAAADARHTAFGNSAWTGEDAVKEAALRRATAYIEQAYRTRWTGQRKTQSQALSWPRYDVIVDGCFIASDSVPSDIANACADLALRALSADLAEDTTRAVIREKVGPLETEYDPNSPQGTRYRAIDAMLAPYLAGGGASVRLIRA
ncbi:DnaT-like ssDNA-binding protein [Sphingobium bisphenolivorans]|uniref:DnaT-like ssDNA-binding protein n=1 Tax=Sphingobium bisphenolivorans TaxID=1335760 RepID=UPI0003A1C80E|nr:DnaT-like ssDNA-binding protein [Sphingobium bisphenolivorans]